MFERELIPMRVADIRHESIEHDDKEVSLVVMTMEISPFTAELAADLDDFMRGALFTRTNAVVMPKLQGATFDLSERPQEVLFRMAADQAKPSLAIAEAKVGVFKARRSKKTSSWRLVFDLTFAPASKDQLAQAVDARLKSRYVTFADATPDLFSETGKEERKARRAASTAAGGTATAH